MASPKTTPSGLPVLGANCLPQAARDNRARPARACTLFGGLQGALRRREHVPRQTNRDLCNGAPYGLAGFENPTQVLVDACRLAQPAVRHLEETSLGAGIRLAVADDPGAEGRGRIPRPAAPANPPARFVSMVMQRPAPTTCMPPRAGGVAAAARRCTRRGRRRRASPGASCSRAGRCSRPCPGCPLLLAPRPRSRASLPHLAARPPRWAPSRFLRQCPRPRSARAGRLLPERLAGRAGGCPQVRSVSGGR